MTVSRPTDWYKERDRIRRELETEGEDLRLLSNLAYAELRCGDCRAAGAAAGRALETDASYAPAWINLGAMRLQLGDYAGAEAAGRRALAIEPESAPSQLFYGHVCRELGQVHQAQNALLDAVRLEPGNAKAWATLALIWMDLGQHVQALNAIERALAIEPHRPEFLSNRMMIAQYHPSLDSLQLRRMAEAWGDALKVETLPPPARRSPGPLRIAYLSPDLRAHPVGYILRGVIDAHDPDRVSVSIWNLFTGDDWLAREYRGLGLDWHDVAGLSDAALTNALRNAEIDILVDLAGHTAHNRLGVLARRPARRQLSFLGWFAALGVPGLDAVLMGSEQLAEGFQSHFAEPVHPLPGCHFRYRRLPHAPAAPAEDPNGPVRFGCFNNTAKLHAEVIDAWARILEAAPEASLELRWKTLADPRIRDPLAARFRAAGVDPARLRLFGAAPHDELLAAYRNIHIALDPFPFSGGMTTLEALSMGVPVVTLAQLRPVSRQGHAMVRAAGLEELSTNRVRDYVNTAIDLARDGERRQRLRRRLIDNFDNGPLADAAGLARDLEEAYEAVMAGREGV